MQTGARNSLKGTIKAIEPGAAGAQVIVELSNGVEVAPDYRGKIRRNA